MKLKKGEFHKAAQGSIFGVTAHVSVYTQKDKYEMIHAWFEFLAQNGARVKTAAQIIEERIH